MCEKEGNWSGDATLLFYGPGLAADPPPSMIAWVEQHFGAEYVFCFFEFNFFLAKNRPYFNIFLIGKNNAFTKKWGFVCTNYKFEVTATCATANAFKKMGKR